MAKPTTRKKNLDIATAEQADGEVYSARSAYELVGIRDIHYREKSYAEYEARIRNTHLSDLHHECYKTGVVASNSKDETIRRMLDRYLRENPREREALAAANQKAARGKSRESYAEQAARILSQGR